MALDKKVVAYVVSKDLNFFGTIRFQLFTKVDLLSLQFLAIGFFHEMSDLGWFDVGQDHVGRDETEGHQRDGLLHDGAGKTANKLKTKFD